MRNAHSCGSMAHEARRPHVGPQDAGRNPIDGGAAGSRGRERGDGDCFIWIQPHHDLQVAEDVLWARARAQSLARHARQRSAAQAHASAGASGVSLDQRTRSAPVRIGLRVVDARHRCHVDRAEVRRATRRDSGRHIAGQARADAAEAAATGLSARWRCHRTLAARDLPRHCTAGQARGCGHLFLGRVRFSRRHRAWQDVGVARADPGCAPPGAQAIGLGRLGGQLAWGLLVLSSIKVHSTQTCSSSCSRK